MMKQILMVGLDQSVGSSGTLAKQNPSVFPAAAQDARSREAEWPHDPQCQGLLHCIRQPLPIREISEPDLIILSVKAYDLDERPKSSRS
jgi:hypothetical protein